MHVHCHRSHDCRMSTMQYWSRENNKRLIVAKHELVMPSLPRQINNKQLASQRRQCVAFHLLHGAASLCVSVSLQDAILCNTNNNAVLRLWRHSKVDRNGVKSTYNRTTYRSAYSCHPLCLQIYYCTCSLSLPCIGLVDMCVLTFTVFPPLSQ